MLRLGIRTSLAKRVQHVAPNNVAISCLQMLRSFGRSSCKCWANNVGICCVEMSLPFGRWSSSRIVKVKMEIFRQSRLDLHNKLKSYANKYFDARLNY